MNDKINAFIKLMQREIKLFTEFREFEETLRLHINDFNWEGLKEINSNVNSLSEEINIVENDRHNVYLELKEIYGNNSDKGFYHLIAHFPEKERDLCGDLYRKLKMTIIKVQGINAGIDAHVNTVVHSINSVLNRAYPHRKGCLYSKNGKQRNSEEDAMLINRHL